MRPAPGCLPFPVAMPPEQGGAATGPLLVVSAETIDRALDFARLIEALRTAFVGDMVAPPRHHHTVGAEGHAIHLLMPAWTGGSPGPGAFLGTKIVNVFRDNARLGMSAVLGSYLLQSGETGAPLAVMDGTRLTYWRTAAASGLAADYLARRDSRNLLMVGSGALAPFLVRAHAAVRPIEQIRVWNHRRAGAEALVVALSARGIAASVADDLEAAVRGADVISCATLSSAPLVRGDWLSAGQHVDLVGAFTFAMREVDDTALRRARVFIDTDDATEEGGDVAIAIRDGAIPREAIQATLHQLCRGERSGRVGNDDLTLFKSTGTAIEDLAAAILVWERLAET